MTYTFDLNVAETYLAGRYVLNTVDGLFWDLTRETGGYYGAFHDTTTQTHPLINTPVRINIGSALSQQGVRLVDGYRIVYDHDGVYNITVSVHVHNTHTDAHDAKIWLKRNGDDEVASGRLLQVPGRHSSHGGGTGDLGHVLGTFNYVASITAGQYHELWWSVNDLGTSLQSVAAAGSEPNIPSVAITIFQI